LFVSVHGHTGSGSARFSIKSFKNKQEPAWH